MYEVSSSRAAPSVGSIILDVRTAEEYAESHVPGARNIPVHELGYRYTELGSDLSQSIVLYCRSGARSALATKMLRDLGFSQLKDIGPMSNWRP
jgi:rhodanese-related sulfurtransferase